MDQPSCWLELQKKQMNNICQSFFLLPSVPLVAEVFPWYDIKKNYLKNNIKLKNYLKKISFEETIAIRLVYGMVFLHLEYNDC